LAIEPRRIVDDVAGSLRGAPGSPSPEVSRLFSSPCWRRRENFAPVQPPTNAPGLREAVALRA